MQLNADILHGFQGTVLSSGYDAPQPTPPYHRDMWELSCSSKPWVAMAAPRGHAKSTAITHAFVLASVLFRLADYVLIVSNTEGQSIQFLNDIKNELLENEDLRQLFGIDKLLKDSETVIVVRTKDRHHFRIDAKGSGQKLRGVKWLGKRPNLIVGDDLEDDEMVMSQERRLKFKQWFYNALLPAGSDNCRVRIVGTILHNDSLLQNLLDDDEWATLRFEAHNDDFSEILWPEKFSKERLMRILRTFDNQGNLAGYYQEYRNIPIDPTNAYFRPEDLIPMDEEDHYLPMNKYAAVDFAISKNETADRTVMVVGGLDPDNILHIIDLRVGRMDSKEIIDEMLSIQRRHDPEIMTLERGAIEKSLGPYLNEAMIESGEYINLEKMTPVQDKQLRARSFQARMRAGGVRFNTEASWFRELKDELLMFPRGKHDDIVDALAWLGLTLDKFSVAPTYEEQQEAAWEEEWEDNVVYLGINKTTGY